MIRYQLVRIMKKFFYPKETVDTLLTDKSSIEIQKSQVVDFPTSLPMASHTHLKTEITDFPATIPPSSHDHGNITNAGVITGKANKNVVTDGNGKITTEDKYSHPSHTAVTGVPTSNLNLTFGGNFQVSQPVVDNQGHVNQLNPRTLSLPTLPVASTSKQGIIKIGSDSNSAAAGNHAHQGTAIPFTPSGENWEEIGSPTNVSSALNSSFEYCCEEIDKKQNTLTTKNTSNTSVATKNATVYFTKYGKMVVADFNFKHSNENTLTHLVNVPSSYAPASHYTQKSLPHVQLADTAKGTFSTVYMTLDSDTYKLYLQTNVKSKSQTVAGQLVWITD